MILIGAKCKKCRSLGMKILWNERCASPKCALIRRRTRPGVHGKKNRTLSVYARQLLEKQKLKYMYLLKERQLKNYFEKAQKSKTSTPEILVQLLERRLDNVVWRAGYVPAKTTARQLVAHGHFLVNGRRITIPSYQVDVGDIISIRPKSRGIALFHNLKERLMKYRPPSWLEVNPDTTETKIVRLPNLEDANLNIDLNVVIDFYNK